MNTQMRSIILLLTAWIAFSCITPAAGKEKKDEWQTWLKEVDPIITHLERVIIKTLKTAEERIRFKDAFWKARDSIPETPVNEYQVEYYQRAYYAQHYLGGTQSDRGKIYILLGKPESKTTYVGHQDVIDCEVWSYEGKDLPGLVPFMSFIFFKPHNMGDFQLYYPGIHSPRDLLLPNAADRIKTNYAAYKEIKKTSTELASASLSVIPGEGDPHSAMPMTSTNYVLNNLAQLPEREAETGYIRNFFSPTGTVEVSHSTNAVRGYGYSAVTRNKGIYFLHYAMMPDRLNFKQTTKDVYSADINLLISIEDLKGNVIYQNKKPINLRFDTARKQQIDRQRIVFRDFLPIVEGQFTLISTFMNKTTDEFFTFEDKITISKDSLLDVVGFKLNETNSPNYIPFSSDRFHVMVDPHFTFSQKDALEGIITASQTPEISLQRIGDSTFTVKVPIITAENDPNGNVYKFRMPLTEVKDGNYHLIMKTPTSPTIARKIYILPFYIDVNRPYAMEKPGDSRAKDNFLFLQAQEYLTLKKIDQALATFEKIPPSAWNAAAIPIIAKAYYLEGNYSRVIELLEKEDVTKDYPVLLMLANSSIETHAYPRALQYLEKLRAYGDTVEINQLLASTYLCMGNREKAAFFYERSRQLKNNSHLNEYKDQDQVKDQSKEIKHE